MLDLKGHDFLIRFEKIFGLIVTTHLKGVKQYAYFGTDDIDYIIHTRPALFERAMGEIFGGAWPAIKSMTTGHNMAHASDDDMANVSSDRNKE